MSKKAYHVRLGGDEPLQEFIVFAESKQDIPDKFIVICWEPNYDKYADLGFVPPQVLLENNWILRCAECETPVSKFLDEDNEINYDGNQVFCCASCYVEYQARKTFIEQTKKKLATNFPHRSHVSTYYHEGVLSATFKLPGFEYFVTWTSKKPASISMVQSDMIAISKADEETLRTQYKAVRLDGKFRFSKVNDL